MTSIISILGMRLLGLERRRDAAGVWRYYPKGSLEATPPPETKQPLAIGSYNVQLSSEAAKKVRALIELGDYANEEEAMSTLISAGLGTLSRRLRGQ